VQICIIKIADLLIAKFSAYAVAVRRYGKSGLAFKFAPIALCFTIKIYEISFSVGAKNFIKPHFKICGTGTYQSGRQAKIKIPGGECRNPSRLAYLRRRCGRAKFIAFRTQKTRRRGQNLLILAFKASNSRV